MKLTCATVVAILSLTALAQTAQAQGKTREQVQQELIQARHDGLTTFSEAQYPGTEQTIAHNKQLHAVTTHPGEPAPVLDHHDSSPSR
jgi:hypothetical protein